MNGSNGYQTYIDPTKATARTEADGVTVTITLVPNTLTSSGSQSAKK